MFYVYLRKLEPNINYTMEAYCEVHSLGVNYFVDLPSV